MMSLNSLTKRKSRLILIMQMKRTGAQKTLDTVTNGLGTLLA